MPERLTVWGLPDAASLMVSEPVRFPTWVGVKVTLTTQFAPAARLVPLHASLESAKSPEGATLFICKVELFGLVIVTALAAEVVPTSC